MREIKFRAWDKNSKTFITHELLNGEWDAITTPNSFYDLEPWQQYTGLKDKNGVEIYEGDIVKFDGHTYDDKFTGAIEFRDGKFCDSYYGWEIGKYREVIGNTYENPELLKEQND